MINVRYKSEQSCIQHRSRIIVAIGVLAICLAAISPTVTWAAEPVKQEKKVKKPAKALQTRPPPNRLLQKRLLRKWPPQNSPRQRLRETLHPVSVKPQRSTSSRPTKEKPETESSSLEPTSARWPVYGASPSARVIQLSFNRPTTASQRPCQAAERRAWSSSPSPPPREKTQDRSS